MFDFDGTLTDFVASDLQALSHLHRHAGVETPLDTFIEASVDAIMSFHGRVEQGSSNPLLMHLERLQATFAHCGAEWREEYVAVYRDQLVTSCAPSVGAVKLLRALQPHFKLGLLTNAYDGKEQRARLEWSGLDRYFSVVVVSGEVGIFKPDPQIFHHTLDLLGVEPHEALYVGDSPSHDVEGAVAAGMSAVLIRRGPAHPRAFLTVSTLNEILSLCSAEMTAT
ncbi:HAD family hydrolase [Deinococcus metallilatus]|uniref:HAD superfamily hydrolase (TIGR01509 family) n=1 Tax=Deinococcus metallilatus TaxID=1211322 RepID=A0ABR6MQD7_9DEIO|nr:HAD family hydrolase [Deinococcus metallilatus]MBB5294158.1 HAD superfamily hydrolase (TIGR01509 family) [Deinococcus metallilatus]GMA16505.1 hypothetical protein GCM10025871_28360 [Deinococcus metallilatus]